MADDIVERLNRTDDFVVFLAADGENGIRLMTETERRQEAAAEIERLRTERRQLIDAFRIVVRDWCPASVRVPILEEARREQ